MLPDIGTILMMLMMMQPLSTVSTIPQGTVVNESFRKEPIGFSFFKYFTFQLLLEKLVLVQPADSSLSEFLLKKLPLLKNEWANGTNAN